MAGRKASLIRIKYTLNTVDIANDEIPQFYNPLHYHPELELTLVEQSSGSRIVAGSVERFEPGDLVLVGANVPHRWKNDPLPDKTGRPVQAKAIVVKFLPDFPGAAYWEFPEMRGIKQLVHETALQGVKIEGKLRDEVERELKSFVRETPAEQFIHLQSMLLKIAESREYRLLSGVPEGVVAADDPRIARILFILHAQYDRKIELSEMAAQVFLHPHSMCRLFRQKTGTTIFETLHRIRIRKACDLLASGNDPIEIIGSKVGYFSQTLFNRSFRRICRTTPSEYRKNWMKGNA